MDAYWFICIMPASFVRGTHMRYEHEQSSITMQRSVVGKYQECRGKEQEVGRDMPTLSFGVEAML